MLALLLAACGGADKTADLEKVYGQLEEQLTLPEMIRLAPAKLQRSYGIDGEACPQAVVAICGEGLRVDEIWLIEAADEDAAQAILALAENRVAQVCAETENYLPDQYAVAKDARTVRIGRYVALFISPDAEQMESIFRKALEG